MPKHLCRYVWRCMDVCLIDSHKCHLNFAIYVWFLQFCSKQSEILISSKVNNKIENEIMLSIASNNIYNKIKAEISERQCICSEVCKINASDINGTSCLHTHTKSTKIFEMPNFFFFLLWFWIHDKNVRQRSLLR